MHYRDFGTTGIKVSEIAFGGGAVGGLLINADDDTRRKAIRTALDAGINWIDTAPSYGDGKSEQALGWLLEEIDEELYLSTKVRIDATDLSDIPGQVESSLAGSLSRLRRNRVTLLQLHNPIGARTDEHMIGLSDLLKPHGVLDALEQMKQSGLTDHVGITALGDTPSIIRVLKSNRVAAAQVYFNILNPSAAMTPPPAWPCHNFIGIVDTCAEHGVAPMDIRVFSAGIAATTARHGRERPLTPGDTVASETDKANVLFDIIGSRYGTRAQTAVRFALAQQRLACVVVGLAELSHLEEAVAALGMGPLDGEALEEINAVYASYST